MRKQENPLGGWTQLRRTAQEIREGKWLAKAQSRNRASKTAWDLLGIPISLVALCVLWWAGVRFGIMLLHTLRPSITGASIGFSAGPMKLAGLVLLFSPFVVSVASGLWLGNAIVYSIPQARRTQQAKTVAGGIGIEEAQTGLVALALLGLAVYAFLLAIAILLA